MHFKGLNPYNFNLQSAKACFPAVKKATASLIIDEISLFVTSVLIYSAILIKDSISEMQLEKSPGILASGNSIEAPQSGKAVLMSLMTVSISEMSDEMSFPALASLMNNSRSLASWTPSLMHWIGLKAYNKDDEQSVIAY
jgi:hypothetical protein